MIFQINTTTRLFKALASTVQSSPISCHYSDAIASAMAFQITGITIVYVNVCSGGDQRKKSNLRVTGLCEGNSPGPAQMASYAENVYIWWRHHVFQFVDVRMHGSNGFLPCTSTDIKSS